MKKICLILLAIVLGIGLLLSMIFFGFLYSHQKQPAFKALFRLKRLSVYKKAAFGFVSANNVPKR